ncbi:MurR/RpiR family transcriptional regulator [Anaerococcus sp. NML200574]|uniref:MurR/RpiR family transcriptional regulator n=1 Tax=Anaerococcus kampingae TaxID=3115614 RepID=A0ABW9MIS6_9FIRM|nr:MULTISPECIES: MurR/RpiR family transcriptional regulator [unclassified Anaerococcus]MCW6677612.1 MurR/RpiR family transcriptional regulator [Anaerococcus sp. NML200574]MCW6700553.1 MurR/RpiR family transcriptional regulator [Anaerococcus sp. NML200537]
MNENYESILPLIESKYEELTEVEKIIAEYFLETEDTDLTSKTVSNKLFISEAALTRFAKKLNLSGYREFVYKYQSSRQSNFKRKKDIGLPVFDSYREILLKSYNLYNYKDYEKLAEAMLNVDRIYIYGVGSSGYLATEFAQRLIRLGLDAEAITDTHMLLLNSVRLKRDSLVMGISYSGKSIEVIDGLKKAGEKGCKTVLFVANDSEKWDQYFDFVILVAHKQNLEYSNIISPQFPTMIMLDILFKKLYDRRLTSGEVYMQSVNEMLKLIKEKDDGN